MALLATVSYSLAYEYFNAMSWSYHLYRTTLSYGYLRALADVNRYYVKHISTFVSKTTLRNWQAINDADYYLKQATTCHR